MYAHEHIQPPTYRASVTGADLLLVPWDFRLISGSGPCNRLLEAAPARRVAVADLTVMGDEVDDRELVVTQLTASGGDRLREAVTPWANLLAYRRVWFGDRVVTFDSPAAGFGGLARTRCRVCRSQWADRAPEFWLGVQDAGAFPIFCPVCGNPLPQWKVADQDTPPRIRSAGGDSRATRHLVENT